MRTTTAIAALLLAVSVGVADAQNQGSEKGPLSHPTAAPGAGVGTRGMDGSTQPDSPNVRSERSPNAADQPPNATAGTKAGLGGLGGSEPSPNKVDDPMKPQK